MEINDRIFIEKWSKYKYDPVFESFYVKYIDSLYGIHFEKSYLWTANLANVMGNYFSENMILLDYGCGVSRFFNFMSCQLLNFLYYGIEPKNDNGTIAIEIGKNRFGNDKRFLSGFIGDNIENDALDNAHVVLLGSIFTHLCMSEIQFILNKFLPIINRDGIIVFSTFLGEKYNSKSEEFIFRGHTVCTIDQYQKYANENNLILEKKDEFNSGDFRFFHSIFTLRKK